MSKKLIPAMLITWLANAQQPVASDALLNASGNGTEWLSYGPKYVTRI
jgi:hypothetical protein